MFQKGKKSSSLAIIQLDLHLKLIKLGENLKNQVAKIDAISVLFIHYVKSTSFSLYLLYYPRSVQRVCGPISTLLRPINIAPLEEMTQQ